MGQVRESAALGDWLLFATLAAPHVLYAYVWLFPGRWRGIFRRNPVNAFATVASLLKGALCVIVLCRGRKATRVSTFQLNENICSRSAAVCDGGAVVGGG